MHASDELIEARDTLVDAALQRQWTRWPGLRESFGPAQLQHARNDTGFHLDFLVAALWAETPMLFSDYVLWTKVLFANLGMPLDWLWGSLEELRGAVVDVVGGPSAEQVGALIDEAIAYAREHDHENLPHLTPDAPYAALAMRYFEEALAPRRREAVELVRDAVEHGMPVRDVYLHIFRPVQLELGRLWQMGHISIAQEHMATAITQLAMSRISDHVLSASPTGHTAVIACPGRELHELGARMVADFLELDGWRTYYLGGNNPPAEIVEAVRANDASLCALSITLTSHVKTLAETIALLRADERTRDIPVLVGGYPFLLVPALCARVGANACADGALEAVDAARSLVAAP